MGCDMIGRQPNSIRQAIIQGNLDYMRRHLLGMSDADLGATMGHGMKYWPMFLSIFFFAVASSVMMTCDSHSLPAVFTVILSALLAVFLSVLSQEDEAQK